MREQRIVTLVRRLFDRTNDGELGWQEAGDAECLESTSPCRSRGTGSTTGS